MNAQRVGLTALRRAATRTPNTFFTQNLIKASLASNISTTQTRPVATQKVTPTDAQTILAEQRRKRPTSPHLAVYDKRQTFFIGSIWQRFTGAGLTGALYVYGAAYLVAPLVGWHLESASLAAAFGALPFALKGGIKLFVAWPFMFHLLNALKHFYNDLGYGYNKAVLFTHGWILWGLSLASAAGLAFFY